MGQIIIDIPVKQNFHYEIENAEEYRKLLKILDDLSQTENSALTDEDLDDISYAETVARNGDFVSWEDAKSNLR